MASALFAAAACGSSSEGTGGGGTGAGDVGGASEGGSTTGPLVHMNEAELTRMVSYLASDETDGRDEGTAGSQLARNFIIDELTRCGVSPAVAGSFEQPITTGAGVNILGVIPGSDPALADRHVLISAHYDHLGHGNGEIYNGADDNAAGVAIILGVACALAESPPARSVIVASWDAEEPPTFLSDAMGSQFYAQNPVVPLAQTDAALVLDLVGGDLWAGFEGHFVLGAELSAEVMSAVAAAPVPEGLPVYRAGLHMAEEQPIGHQPWSDYDAFRNLGVPVLFFSNGQNRQYHTAVDELATINLPKMAREALYLYAITQNLASASATPVFVPTGADYLGDATNMRQVLEQAVAAGGLIDSLGLGAQSRATLETDLADVSAIEQSIAGGTAPTTEQIRRLRDGTQHIMCLAGTTYPESLCNQF
ncbi:MAG: M28 family peptidase [Polyangiaceae bacterium]